ncbi:sulfotransferase [Pseudoruegeria sp. HB172150]|uniref:sulfotransferase n=1 Tax=Pseudoruegeria sp. HB172150 TaxID=2721164 RepID=UPI001557DBAC|nr:sulfotransferase [Pseudoruegeria sp. HB172150]
MKKKYNVVSRLISGRKAEKIFAIGENKSGTTSLHRIFQDLGNRSYHGTKWRNTANTGIYYLYDAFCDGTPDDFRKLDQMFLNAKFILQVRELDTWIDSRLEHIRRLPPNRERHPLWTIKESSIRAWTIQRNAYHIDVLTHFRDRPEDLLLVNYIRDASAPDRICEFLGHEPLENKPHENVNPRAGKALKNADMIASALGHLGIPSEEWGNDIHCPSLSPEGSHSVPADTDHR